MYIDYSFSLLFRGDFIESVCILEFMTMPSRPRLIIQKFMGMLVSYHAS